jgi:monoamine oxidase
MQSTTTPPIQAVVIGSSLSGLIAAYELGKQNIEVLVLERDVTFGGKSRSAIGGINLVDTVAQHVRGTLKY